jgi:hypothetical protein
MVEIVQRSDKSSCELEMPTGLDHSFMEYNDGI